MALIIPLPDELKLENYERRPNAALFDRLDLVVCFHPGHKGIGAVVKSFRDAIKAHDEMVVKVEAQMIEVEIKKRIYKKKNRLFRNLDSAWNLILENPVQYYEYLCILSTRSSNLCAVASTWSTCLSPERETRGIKVCSSC